MHFKVLVCCMLEKKSHFENTIKYILILNYFISIDAMTSAITNKKYLIQNKEAE